MLISNKTLFNSHLLRSSLILLLLATIISSFVFLPKKAEIKLLNPKDGSVLSNNMPNLSWTAIKCQKYELWVDGIKMDTISSTQNSYVVFPLSFGKHQWHVIAITSDGNIKSETGHFTIDDKPLSTLPENAQLLRYNWFMESSVVAGNDGQKLSSEKVETANWSKTTIPATVLTVLVRNGVYPNPYIGLNNMKIPDANDAFNQSYNLLTYSHLKDINPWKDPYWFRTEFEVPANYEGKKIWINFGEINYRAQVWLNGKQVSDTSTMVGMERAFRFNISTLVKKDSKNYLAVAIYPPDHPGKPDPEPITPLSDPGTNMADGMIALDYTRWDVLGWDWIPAVRDRDMGLVEDIYLTATDEIELNNLYVTSNLPLPDTTTADLTISADLVNHSGTQKSVNVNVSIRIDGEEITFNQAFTVEANQTKELLFDKQNISALHLSNPKLWWPFGYGNQNLYALKIIAKANSGEESAKKLNFGIRKVETYIGANERVYKINGKEIYLKGGNWVLDMMLNWNARRYEDEILLTKNCNLNILRIWGPTGAPPESFYEAADKYGVLLWQDFLNDFWGTFKNNPNFKPNEKLFELATIEIVKKYRNHPSLIMWCGGNEGPNPREELIMNKILPKYDGRDSKHYLKISNGDGLHGGGPYHTIEPKEYFTHENLQGFSSEIGPSGVPVYESMIKFLPQLGKEWKPGFFPLSGDAAYHDANDRPGSDTRKFSEHHEIIRRYYGISDTTNPTGVYDYLNKCQVLNYEVYRASIESINRLLWNKASGVALWKSNAAWPSITWQVYDWYLQAHAGFYGTQKAGESVHIQMNRDDNKVVVLNTLHQKMEGVKLNATLYGSDLKILWTKSKTVDLIANGNTHANWKVPVENKLCFLKLTAYSQAGKLLSENFYWLHGKNDFTGLANLPQPLVAGTFTIAQKDGRTYYEVTLKNSGKSLVFMAALKLRGKDSNQEILPSIWSDNYLNLLPGESKTVHLNVNDNDLTEPTVIEVKAYNMKVPVVLKQAK